MIPEGGIQYELLYRRKSGSAERTKYGDSCSPKATPACGPRCCQRYGWGVHFNAEGKISLYAKESPEYDHFTSHEDAGVKLLNAMRSKRS
ncbi:DUF6157 family protein [Paenibacillus sp. FSL H3-0321]|uniref:DUF6157 family protein n=1 Tax=Paenibacillus sp. FSL H3-0321 TaxID=2921372 RepID=UPI0030F6F841